MEDNHAIIEYSVDRISALDRGFNVIVEYELLDVLEAIETRPRVSGIIVNGDDASSDDIRGILRYATMRFGVSWQSRVAIYTVADPGVHAGLRVSVFGPEQDDDLVVWASRVAWMESLEHRLNQRGRR